MNNLDSVFKRRIFDDEGAAEGASLTTEQQLSIVAIVWRVVMLSRWDKNNFDGNDDLPWLCMVAAVLEEMRTDLLAFGIQVRVASLICFRDACLCDVAVFYFCFRATRTPPPLSAASASSSALPLCHSPWLGADPP
jgi:hypothetical protein